MGRRNSFPKYPNGSPAPWIHGSNCRGQVSANSMPKRLIYILFVLTACIVCIRFRPNLMDTYSADLYAYMRATSSFLHDVTDKALLANLKRFIVDQSELPTAAESCPSSPAKSALGGRAASFSPQKKPKPLDTRPAILARKTWTITIDRQRGTVTLSSKPCFQNLMSSLFTWDFNFQIFVVKLFFV